ncbi:hypothetical protein BGLA2_420109 [Burkholderia gladioli]|nr:hypothetical protein [Burkholderia gladioli]CAG9227801.1 hypothetical protein BGLA2_420109 [Burkholderia gladioli]
MKNAAANFLLIVLIEAVSAVVVYLKDRLTGNLRRSDDGTGYDPDFACC